MKELAIDDDQIAPGEHEHKLTDWKKEPALKTLMQDLTNSKTDHDGQITKIKEWADYRNGTGKAAPATVKGQSKVQPKLIRKQAEWRYSALSEPFLSTPDLFKLSPVSWEDKKGAEQNELILNMQFRAQLDRTALIDEMVRAAVDDGTVVLRTGWQYDEVTELKPEPVYSQILDPSVLPVY